MRTRFNLFTNTAVIYNGVTNPNISELHKELKNPYKVLSDVRKKHLRNYIRFMFHEKEHYTKMLTVTTCQHQSEFTDSECLNIFLKYIHRYRFYFDNYVWVAERQKETKDIHFHVVCDVSSSVWSDKETFVITCTDGTSRKYYVGIMFEMLKYLNKRFPNTGSNVLNIKQYNNPKHLAHYLSKYVSKNNSWFWCRVSQVSRGLIERYKKESYKYIFDMDLDVEDILSMPEIYGSSWLSVRKIE